MRFRVTASFQGLEPFDAFTQLTCCCCREVPAACVAAQDAVDRDEQVPLEFWDHLFNEKDMDVNMTQKWSTY